MKITSAKFIKGVVGEDDLLADGKPQVVFVGRSNVGKSSVINSITEKGLARTSSFPGRTQEINIYLINKDFYILDLPGYGFAKASREMQEKLQQIIYWYLFDSPYKQKMVFLIIDAAVGLTDNDIRMLNSLEENGKKVVIVANKADKIKKTSFKNQLKKIQDSVGEVKIIPYSAEKKIGAPQLLAELSF